MAEILVAPGARQDLERLIRTHSLPPDTKDRVARSLRPLGRFPLLGTELAHGRWSGYRFLLGPWRWMIVLYAYDADGDTVMVAAFEDGRASVPASSSR